MSNYLFIPRPSPPNGGWPTTKETHELTPLIPSTPSTHECVESEDKKLYHIHIMSILISSFGFVQRQSSAKHIKLFFCTKFTDIGKINYFKCKVIISNSIYTKLFFVLSYA